MDSFRATIRRRLEGAMQQDIGLARMLEMFLIATAVTTTAITMEVVDPMDLVGPLKITRQIARTTRLHPTSAATAAVTRRADRTGITMRGDLDPARPRLLPLRLFPRLDPLKNYWKKSRNLVRKQRSRWRGSQC